MTAQELAQYKQDIIESLQEHERIWLKHLPLPKCLGIDELHAGDTVYYCGYPHTITLVHALETGFSIQLKQQQDGHYRIYSYTSLMTNGGLFRDRASSIYAKQVISYNSQLSGISQCTKTALDMLAKIEPIIPS